LIDHQILVVDAIEQEIVRRLARTIDAQGLTLRATYRKMIQNLVWATGYNLIAIPVAAGLFVHWGFDLPMSIGAVAMSLSTIIVAANAQLLRRLNLVTPSAMKERPLHRGTLSLQGNEKPRD